MKRAFLLIAVAFVSGCDSSIEDVGSFPSPDGQHVLQIVTELQAANDPAPWWQHVTVRKPGSKPSTRGSIASFEGREPREKSHGPARRKSASLCLLSYSAVVSFHLAPRATA